MCHLEQVITKRWIPILKDYEEVRERRKNRKYKFVIDLCRVHRVSNKELRRYYQKWIEGGRKEEAILPSKRGPRPRNRCQAPMGDRQLLLMI